MPEFESPSTPRNKVTTQWNSNMREHKYHWISGYIVKETIGRGTFGKIKLGIDVNNGMKVALKVRKMRRKL
jgi:serine/threonine protein kinase